jgi:hypothetical protein
MFIHVAWNIGNIEVGVGLVREFLELGVERFLSKRSEAELKTKREGADTYPSERDLIPKPMEAANTILGVVEVVVLNEAEAMNREQMIILY